MTQCSPKISPNSQEVSIFILTQPPTSRPQSICSLLCQVGYLILPYVQADISACGPSRMLTGDGFLRQRDRLPLTAQLASCAWACSPGFPFCFPMKSHAGCVDGSKPMPAHIVGCIPREEHWVSLLIYSEKSASLLFVLEGDSVSSPEVASCNPSLRSGPGKQHSGHCLRGKPIVLSWVVAPKKDLSIS